MGIGASKGQGSEATYEKRDVETVSVDKSNWPELAGAKLAESNGPGRKSYSVAQDARLESSDVYGDEFSRERTRWCQCSIRTYRPKVLQVAYALSIGAKFNGLG